MRRPGADEVEGDWVWEALLLREGGGDRREEGEWAAGGRPHQTLQRPAGVS